MILAVLGGLAIAAGTGWVAVVVLGTKNEPAAPLDITKVALVVAGGVGGAVALVVAYRRQRDLESARFIERFGAAATQLGSPYTAVRVAGVYAMAVVADESTGDRRQQCIDVLCGYLRLPYDPTHGESGRTKLVTKTVVQRDNVARDVEAEQEEHTEYRQNDKVVRQTIVRVLAAHLRDHDNSWSDNNFDFTTAHLEDADFREATFSGTAVFDKATFSSDARFSGATFSNDARFNETTFSNDAWFDESTFSGDAWFNKATFSNDARFNKATFSGDARFNKATFSGDARFNKATFSGDARFNETTFSNDARFNKATFSGDARFNKATFSGDAWFREATFSSDAGFGTAAFSGDAWFDESTFSGDARFYGASFSSTTVFDKARFSGNVGFNQAMFSSDAGFIEAIFSSDAWFSGARFSGTTGFDGATFSATASFDKATFDASEVAGATVSFRGVGFGSSAVSFDNPRQWGPPTPAFDWNTAPSTKPDNVLPTSWPPTPVP